MTGIDLPAQPVGALRSALERGLAACPDGEAVAVFACAHAASAHAAGVETDEIHGGLVHRLECAALLPPSFVEYALRAGAAGVALIACRHGECAYRLGDSLAAQRLRGEREPSLRASVPPERWRVIHAGPGEERLLRAELALFRASLARAGRTRSSPPKRIAREVA